MFMLEDYIRYLGGNRAYDEELYAEFLDIAETMQQQAIHGIDPGMLDDPIGGSGNVSYKVIPGSIGTTVKACCNSGGISFEMDITADNW